MTGRRVTSGWWHTFAVTLPALALVIFGSGSRAATPLRPIPNVVWSITPAPSASANVEADQQITRIIKPGQVVEETLRVRVSGSEPLNVTLAKANGGTDPAGAFDLVGPGAGPIGLANWMTLGQDSVTVGAGTFVDVPLTITIPSDAGSGDLVGGIIASVRSGAPQPGGGALIVRQGVRINLRIEGPIQPDLKISDVRLHATESANPFRPWELEVGYTVTNTGNIRLGAQQKIDVRTVLGDKSFAPAAIPELLPGDRLELSTTVAEALRLGRGTASIVLTPFPAFKGEVLTPLPPSVTAAGSIWNVPWILIAELAATATVLWAAVRARRRRRSG